MFFVFLFVSCYECCRAVVVADEALLIIMYGLEILDLNIAI